VTHAEFVVSAFTEHDFPREELPEVVIAGRSNVGKSSLINRLAGTRGLARTGSTPGKTRSINFYRFDRFLFLVDLPGFGYTKAGKAASREWARLIERYFQERSTLALAMQLVDARMQPTALDLEMAEWLDRLNIPRVVIATKADKLSGNSRVKQSRAISRTFGGGPVILSSAVTGLGCTEIWKRINETVRK
jgi:GTP-binding protein